MANLDERVTGLEAQFGSQTRAIDGLRTEIAELRGELRTSVAQLRSEMATRTDLTELGREMVHRLEITDAKIDRLFVWTVGLMVSGFFVVIGGLVGVAFR